MKINEAIKSARDQSGLTQVELAEKIGNSQSGITKLENGHRMPSGETISRIEQATGVSILPYQGEWEVMTKNVIAEMLKSENISQKT